MDVLERFFFSEIHFCFFEKEEHSCDEVTRIDYTHTLRPFTSLKVLWNRYCSGCTAHRMRNIYVMSVAPT